MSDRDLALPDRAYERAITSLLTASRMAAATQKWPGSARLEFYDAGGGTRIAPPNTVVTTMLSMTLDPGRWVIYVGLYTEDSSSSSPGRYTINAWINYPGGPPFKTSITQFVVNAAFGFSETTLALGRSVKLNTVGTVSFSVQPVTTITTVRVRAAYLLAVSF